MDTTSVFSKNLQAYIDGYRTIVNKGGTRSSKTWSTLQLLYIIALKSKKPRLISIVSESFPHLRRGCMRDFEKMLKDDGLWDDANWNATDKIYRVGVSSIEFFGVDSPGKVHGPARDILYMNECINVAYEIYRQLMARTTETIFLDYNPAFEFWVDEKVLPESDAILIHSTYKDNEKLSPAQVRDIEKQKHIDPAWFEVYGLGLTGKLTGTILTNWDIVTTLPQNYKRRFIGIDFGFTNDPTAIVDVILSEGDIWIDEIAYDRGLTNPDISRIIIDRVGRGVPIIADSAEPKSIAEIRNHGLSIEGALKGKDSIEIGLQVMNRYNKHITQRSTNILDEYRRYRWAEDKNGNSLRIPIDKYNHSIDAQRYVFLNKFANLGGSYSVSSIKRN